LLHPSFILLSEPAYLRRVEHDDRFMQRCFALAGHGLGLTWPNPLVGCAVVCDGQILAEGFHKKAGLPHAEVEAIRRIEDSDLLRRATVYVNLEPCSHHGRTPPCASMLVKAGVKRVVIANTDPFPAVSGTGISLLREAGIEVTTGVLEKEGAYLNRRFFMRHRSGRPWVVLKWAQTADGFMDRERKSGETGSFPISGKQTNRLVHLWRSQEQAILVGTRTALTDNPELTVRHVEGPQPIRWVIDRHAALPGELRLFQGEQPARVLRGEHPGEWLQQLCESDIQSVLVEGGAATLQAFLASGLWDEARVIQAPLTLGRGLRAPVIPSPAIRREVSGDDLIHFYFRK